MADNLHRDDVCLALNEDIDVLFSTQCMQT